MVTEPGRAPLLTRCLQLNVLALAFSLAHLIVDWHIGLFGASSQAMSAPQASEQPLGRAAWALPAVALAVVVALFALQASLALP